MLESVFNKVAGLRPVNLGCEFCEISKNAFFTYHLWTTAPIKLIFTLTKNVRKQVFPNLKIV